MDSKAIVLSALRSQGVADATALQNNADNMTGTELHNEAQKIPEFNNEKQYLNYKIGFVCKSKLGNVVRLLQSYDSLIYPQQPEELAAQWGFKWSTNPEHAKPFLKSVTSPYMKYECCIWEDEVYKSTIDNNTYTPAEYPAGWVKVGKE